MFAALAALTITLAPARADRSDPADEKKDGGIDPSNTAVVDGDLNAMAADGLLLVQSQPAAMQIGAAEAHMLVRGRGILVAVLDGGFDLDHPVIAPAIAGAFDAIDMDGDPTDRGNGTDDDGDGFVDAGKGHGTFVTAMVRMAAPDARILAIRVRDDEGFGTNEAIAIGLQHAIDAGANVINLSLDAAQAANTRLNQAINEAVRAGIIVVVAAGNDGADSLGTLAETRGVIAVGAVDLGDQVAEFSNTDDSGRVDMSFAPGVDLYGPLGESEMGFWSGTSFSAGIVSGAVALLLEMVPVNDGDLANWFMQWSADPVYDENGEPQNAGRINLARLVWGG